jgi:hypothetical protein
LRTILSGRFQKISQRIDAMLDPLTPRVARATVASSVAQAGYRLRPFRSAV